MKVRVKCWLLVGTENENEKWESEGVGWEGLEDVVVSGDGAMDKVEVPTVGYGSGEKKS